MAYRDSNNIDHESYDAACAYYGADTIESLLAADAEDAFQEYFFNLNRPDQGFPVDERTARAMFAARPVAPIVSDNLDDIPF